MSCGISVRMLRASLTPKARMNLIPDLIWKIARHLDVYELQKLWKYGLPEFALSIRNDEQFWKTRVVEHIGRDIDIQSEDDSWRVVYVILKRDAHLLVNREDSVLAHRLGLMCGDVPDHNTAYLAAELGCPRILRCLLSRSDVNEAFAPRLDLLTSSAHWPLDGGRGPVLLNIGLRSGCLEIARILFAYPRTSGFIHNKNDGLIRIVSAEKISDRDTIALVQMLLAHSQCSAVMQRGIVLTQDWLIEAIECRSKPELLDWMWTRPEIDITTTEVWKAIIGRDRIDLMQRLLSDPRVDVIATGTAALEYACLFSESFQIARWLLSDRRFIPSRRCVGNARHSYTRHNGPDLLYALLDDVRVDVRAKYEMMLEWIRRAWKQEEPFEFWSSASERAFRLEHLLEYVCDLEEEKLDVLRVLLGTRSADTVLRQKMTITRCHALSYAARRGHIETAMLVLGYARHGEDAVKRALEEARQGGRDEMVALLERHS